MTLEKAIELVASGQLNETMLRVGEHIAHIYRVDELIRVDLSPAKRDEWGVAR